MLKASLALNILLFVVCVFLYRNTYFFAGKIQSANPSKNEATFTETKSVPTNTSYYKATLQEGMDCSKDALPDFLFAVQGLSHAEPWGRWSDASKSSAVTFTFKNALPQNFILKFKARATLREQTLTLTAGEAQQTLIIPKGETMSEYAIRFSSVKSTSILLLTPSHPISPKDVKIGEDLRKLGVAFERIWIEQVD